MKAAASLIRISNYQVEVLQKRLAEIVERRSNAEVGLAILAAEGDAETAHAAQNAGAGWYLIGYRQGLKIRMEAVQGHIDACLAEEAGARDALAEAFEALKKYEHIEANAKAAAVKEQAKRETAALDELGLRRRSGK
jgi:flagellar FliJ protein